jgi:hypothetical protein
MIDEALLEKVQALISQRQRIDRELEEIFGGTPRRGRPRKGHGSSETWSEGHSTSVTHSSSEGTTFIKPRKESDNGAGAVGNKDH